jgi:hypothetical protein
MTPTPLQTPATVDIVFPFVPSTDWFSFQAHVLHAGEFTFWFRGVDPYGFTDTAEIDIPLPDTNTPIQSLRLTGDVTHLFYFDQNYPLPAGGALTEHRILGDLRIVQVPEPALGVLIGMALVAGVRRRWRVRQY